MFGLGFFPFFRANFVAFLHSEGSQDAGSFGKMYMLKLAQNVGCRTGFLKVICYFLNQAIGSQIGQLWKNSH